MVEQFEAQIETLTLLQESESSHDYMQKTISAQSAEIRRLNQTIKNKSQQLLTAHRISLHSQKEFQIQLAAAEQTNRQLQTRIRELEKCLEADHPPTPQLDSHNSSLPPSLDPPWSKPKRTRSLRTTPGLKVGGQSGHRGVTLLQVADPDSIVIHQVEVCAHCQNSLLSVESNRFQKRQLFEIENGRSFVIEHRIEIKHCRLCQQVTKGAFPGNVKAPVQYGASVLSRIVYLNQYQLLPVARTAESMKDLFECPVSLATVQRAATVCSHKLMRYEYRLKAAVRNSEVVGADETGIRINGQIAWVHIARTDQLTHLAAHFKRGRQAFEEIGIINRFEGVLVRDGFLSYRHYEQCRHSLCNAHLLRNLTFVAENEPAHKVWTDALAVLLLRIKEAVHQAKLNSGTALTSAQQIEYTSCYDNILSCAEQAVRGSPKRQDSHLSGHRLYRRFLINKEAILMFMTDFRVPFDNNGSKRDLRMLKLQQKISGCFRTIAGVKVFCRIRSYLSSIRKQGRGLLIAIEVAVKGKPIGLPLE